MTDQDRPELLVVFAEPLDNQTARNIRAAWDDQFPGMRAAFIHGETAFYQPAPNGDYNRLEPLPVLAGEDVAAWLDQQAEDA